MEIVAILFSDIPDKFLDVCDFRIKKKTHFPNVNPQLFIHFRDVGKIFQDKGTILLFKTVFSKK